MANQRTVDTSELSAFADTLRAAADDAPDQVRAFLVDAGQQIHRRMRDEVPVDEGETRDSITVVDDDMAVEVGPTNRDAKGRPVGFFIEHGARDIPPDPFVLRTATWAGKHFPDQAPAIFEGLL